MRAHLSTLLALIFIFIPVGHANAEGKTCRMTGEVTVRSPTRVAVTQECRPDGGREYHAADPLILEETSDGRFQLPVSGFSIVLIEEGAEALLRVEKKDKVVLYQLEKLEEKRFTFKPLM
jgi:hypothetical protein